MTPFLVSHYAVDEIFPKVAGYLATALGHHTGWTLPELHSACSSRSAFLFVDAIEHPDNALVGRFEAWGGRQVFNIIIMAGEGGHYWPDALEPIKQFARQLGAQAVVFHGRKGWQRALPEMQELYRTYEVAL